MHALARLLMTCGLILLVAGWWNKDALPDQPVYDPVLLQEPEQTPVQRPAFQQTVEGITYTIQPLYRYKLQGLVVSQHDATSWRDYLHQEWNDKLNVMDLCVVWGNNVRQAAWRDIAFSSGQFTCNFFTRSEAAYRAFDQSGLSNNHLLAANSRVADRILAARIGDQIRLRGYLAEYSHHHGFEFRRGTSTVRTDTGNGACETIYVEDFEILRRGGGPWRYLQWLGLAMLAVGVIGWLALPVRIR